MSPLLGAESVLGKARATGARCKYSRHVTQRINSTLPSHVLGFLWALIGARENTMHQYFQQLREVLDALRTRSAIATSNFYQLAGIDRPVTAARFKVAPVSKDLFRITDSASGKVMGWRRTHGEACSYAGKLEREVA